MSITGYKRAVVLLTLTTLAAVALSVALFFAAQAHSERYMDLKRSMDFLMEFDHLRTSATNADTGIAVAALADLDYLDLSRAQYHRPTPYDRLIERERQRAMREVIAILRTRLGEDLGGDPKKWLEKYGK